MNEVQGRRAETTARALRLLRSPSIGTPQADREDYGNKKECAGASEGAQRTSRTGLIDGSIERSEATEGILAIAGIEIGVAQTDVELQVDVGVFLGQVAWSALFPGPIVAFEADRQVQLRVDEEPHLVEL